MTTLEKDLETAAQNLSNVRTTNAGIEADRAKYASDERTILINLDHPQLAAALKSATIESPSFQRLAYEIAFSEYALGLVAELAREGRFVSPTEPVEEVRDTLNWLAREAAKQKDNEQPSDSDKVLGGEDCHARTRSDGGGADVRKQDHVV